MRNSWTFWGDKLISCFSKINNTVTSLKIVIHFQDRFCRENIADSNMHSSETVSPTFSCRGQCVKQVVVCSPLASLMDSSWHPTTCSAVHMIWGQAISHIVMIDMSGRSVVVAKLLVERGGVLWCDSLHYLWEKVLQRLAVDCQLIVM